MNKIYDLVIIGSGPAGMSAALYASRANLKVLMIDKGAPGGQLLNTNTIENYVGAKNIDANELASSMYKDAIHFGTEYNYGEVESIITHKNKGNNLFMVNTKQYSVLTKTIIVATGTQYNKLNIPGEKELDGRGVSYCATCDGAFFNDKKMVVVGGGDSALESAIYLTQYGEVDLVHRRKEYRAKPHLQEMVKKNDKITERLGYNITEVKGEGLVNEAILTCSETYSQYGLPTQGLFISIGHSPNTSFLSEDLLTEDKWINVNKETFETKIKGMYAIGDVIDKPVRQVANAVGEGSEVVHHLLNYIQSL